MAARCAPRATRLISTPARANWIPIYPPIAPAPKMQTFMSCVRPQCDSSHYRRDDAEGLVLPSVGWTHRSKRALEHWTNSCIARPGMAEPAFPHASLTPIDHSRCTTRTLMLNVSEEQARAHMHKLLGAMTAAGGSDLFIASDFPPSMKAHGNMQPLTTQKLSGDLTRTLANAMMNERQRAEFARDLECNFAISVPGLCRFRVNVFVQQQQVGMVIRTIASEIPTCEKLGLPQTLKEIVMNKRGLVLVVGATGSGKSTSLAAMIDHRNATSSGHIITIEDPVEYVHASR